MNYDYTFRNELQQAPWSLLETAKCVDDSVFLWERLFNDVADTHAPMKKRRVKGQRTPWITNKPIEIRRDSDYHHRKAHASRVHATTGICTRNCETMQTARNDS